MGDSIYCSNVWQQAQLYCSGTNSPRRNTQRHKVTFDSHRYKCMYSWLKLNWTVWRATHIVWSPYDASQSETLTFLQISPLMNSMAFRVKTSRRFKSVWERWTVEQRGERRIDDEMSRWVETILSLLLLTVLASTHTHTHTRTFWRRT